MQDILLKEAKEALFKIADYTKEKEMCIRDRPYFDESFEGEYPKEAPFTISELEEIYPTASGKAKMCIRDSSFIRKIIRE